MLGCLLLPPCTHESVLSGCDAVYPKSDTVAAPSPCRQEDDMAVDDVQEIEALAELGIAAGIPT